MSQVSLAINGGKPVIDYQFERYNTIGREEIEAAKTVIESGVLSDFLGKWDSKFYGGKYVKELEKRWAEKFQTDHSITFNSATSALCAAIGACEVGPGDEVIVSPYTMVASATAILSYNAVPIFADIDDKTFNITASTIAKRITRHTKAIMVPSIIGHPAQMDEIMRIARKNNLKVVEDAAQAPGSTLNGKNIGTFGDIGVYSLNRHKHIHTGEGGVAVTDDPDLSQRLMLIRNHGEVTADTRNFKNLVNTFGFNFRLGEIESAMAVEQLKKFDALIENRIRLANRMTENLSDLQDVIQLPHVEANAKHVYYLYAIKYKQEPGAPHRDKVASAIREEGLMMRQGFQKPIYLLAMYQNKIAYGEKGCPFSCPLYEGAVSYEEGLCPMTERIENNEMMAFHLGKYDLSNSDIDRASESIRKVVENLDKV